MNGLKPTTLAVLKSKRLPKDKKLILLPEKEAEEIYYKIYKKVIKTMGHSGMTRTTDLNRFGFKKWKSRFLGTFPQDKLPYEIYDRDSEKYAIINVDTSGMKGTHWVAVTGIKGSNKILVYDSFGRATEDLLPLLLKNRTIDADRDAEQKEIQDSCGQYALAWLMFRDQYGIENAKLI